MPSRMAGKKESSSSSSPPPDACSSTTRLQRNLAEKQRRDKLNGYISELATIVPMVSMASKRLDKTSILRLSAAHLRISQSFLGGSRKRMKNSFKWRPNFFTSEQIREILESVEGFLLVTTIGGKIMYVSHSVEKFLGHQNLEMIGHSIFTFIHPSDSDMVHTQLQSLNLAVEHNNGNSSSSARCSFYCRLRERNQPRSEVLTYQFVHVVGHMASGSDENDIMDDASSSTSSSSSNQILKAFVRLVHSSPYNELSVTDMTEDEYVTRHAPDGTIVFSDHRISTITGHLPHEVYGMSAYEYILKEDIPIALFAHRLMFSNNGGTGMIVYRLRMRNEGCVYLKSTGHLQFAKSAAKVDHFICVNKQLNDEEGEQELKKFIDRFTPHIQGTCPSLLYESIRTIQCFPEVKIEAPDEDLFPERPDVHSVIPASRVSSEVDCKDESINLKLKCFSGNLVGAGPCSKKLYDKISLESDASECMQVNYSPLTESSFSANSPRSEDTYTPSPFDSGVEHLETTLSSSHDTSSSSSEVPNSHAAAQSVEFVDRCQLFACSSPLPSVRSSFCSERNSQIYLRSNSSTTALSSAIVDDSISVASPCVWEGSSSRTDGAFIPTPPPSSSEENSESLNAEC